MIIPSLALTDANGIPTYTAEIAVPFTGTLTFGVGLRDETAPTAGIAHLLEHLIMKRVGKVTIAHNARTDDESIAFFAQGERALVADFLTRVARAISTLDEITDADIEEQRNVIAAELGDGDEYAGRGPLLDRFGAQSVGLLDVGSPGHRSLTREQTLSFADTWLHAGNAALVLTGSVPEGLDVTLPAARPLPDRVAPAVIRSGAWVVNGSTPLCITIQLDGRRASDAILLATAIIADALHAELRTGRSIVYSVQPFIAPLDRDNRFVAYMLDPRPADALPAATEALALLRRLATDGPSDEMLGDAIDQWRQFSADPSTIAETLEGLATSALRGRRERDDLTIPDLAWVTTDDVRTVLADSVSSVFVTFGDGVLTVDEETVVEALGLPFVEMPTPRYASLSKTELFKQLMSAGVESFNPRMFRGMGGSLLIIDHERIACTFPDGIMEIDFDDVALATYSETHQVWAVLALGGDLLVIDPADWRGRAKVHALLETRLPKDRQIRVDAAVA